MYKLETEELKNIAITFTVSGAIISIPFILMVM